MTKLKMAPSILAADFTRLGSQIQEAEAAGADWIHVDVMDGHFVPNISYGPVIAAAARRSTGLPLDTHLMIEHPEQYVEAFADAGCTSLTVHVECCAHLHRTVQQIHQAGVRAGVALNPATPVESVAEILPFVDLVLVMTVNPGFGGQTFIPDTLRKVARLRAMLDERSLGHVDIEVDGGIDVNTAAQAVAAGANVLVAGSAVFNERAAVAVNLAELRRAAEPM